MLGNDQYYRSECIEVVHIPDTGSNNELGNHVLTVFQKTGWELSPQDFEACR